MSSKSELRLDWCNHDAARYACLNWHYSRSLPAGKLVKVGVWEAGQFKGCVLFSRGATAHLGTPYGLTQTECCELTRVSLNEHRAPVSRILAVALKFLKRVSPGLRLVVSFADPEHGHHGGIYQATNWLYTGQTDPSEEYVVNGRRMHARSLASIRPKNMTLKQYARSVDPYFHTVRGSAKHRYLMPLDERLRERIVHLARPYPKRPRPKQAMAETIGTAKGQRLSGRSNTSERGAYAAG